MGTLPNNQFLYDDSVRIRDNKRLNEFIEDIDSKLKYSLLRNTVNALGKVLSFGYQPSGLDGTFIYSPLVNIGGSR